MKKLLCLFILSFFTTNLFSNISLAGILVLQTDFGYKDSAVAEMKGVALQVDENIKIVDATYDIEPYNIWNASYRLFQVIRSFPEKTAFVSVVDPGVGSDRKSIVVKTKTNHYIITPDNGTITAIDKEIGIVEAREIDETKHRLAGSEKSYTFYGRDVYVNTGAKLASGKISFEEVGDKIDIEKLIKFEYKLPIVSANRLSGIIPILDENYGNVWSNINREMAKKFNLQQGKKYKVVIKQGNKVKYFGNVVYNNTFDNVKIGEPVLYINSLNCLSIALNQGDFAKKYNIKNGENWFFELSKQ